MNFLCYLLGRFPAEAPASILDQAYKSVQGRLNAGNYSERLHAKTQARTIAVSQMRLNMHEAGDKFLCGLLRDSELASIDRGYHRLYYSDCVACRDKAPECYLDSPGSSWSKTFKKLQASLKEEFPELGNYTSTQSQDGASAGDGQSVLRQEVQHKIVTLLLFVQSRLGSVNQLETDRHDFARQVIECALRREGWAQELRNYMEMMRVDLGDRDAGKWRLVLDLYRLKWEPRRGWLVRGLHPAFHVGRIESVADHSYFAILLATLLLPPSSSKDETIRILAVHDVAEAYTGDIIFRKLQGDQLGAARIKESEVHDYLCWKETYEGIYDTFPLHERLRAITAESPGTSQQLESVRAAIDIDRMENLIQLYIYRDLYDDWIKPEEFQSFADGLTESMHTEVRNLAKDFVSWADTRRGHLFQDPPRFFDPSLVVMQERVQKQAR
jgi:5'-deoxynucleotidase YfbR-like HD superfamily hydrolase